MRQEQSYSSILPSMSQYEAGMMNGFSSNQYRSEVQLNKAINRRLPQAANKGLAGSAHFLESTTLASSSKAADNVLKVSDVIVGSKRGSTAGHGGRMSRAQRDSKIQEENEKWLYNNSMLSANAVGVGALTEDARSRSIMTGPMTTLERLQRVYEAQREHLQELEIKNILTQRKVC